MEVQTPTATDNRGPRIVAVIITITFISSLFVGLRFYTRAIIKKNTYPEDYIIALALLTLWAEAGFHIVAVRYGEGQHMVNLTPEERHNAQLWGIFASISGIFGLGLPKIALAIMLNRVLFANYWTSMVSWSLSIVTMVNFTVANFMILFQCAAPMEAVWVHDPEGKCYNVWLVIDFCIYASGKTPMILFRSSLIFAFEVILTLFDNQVFSAFGDFYFVSICTFNVSLLATKEISITPFIRGTPLLNKIKWSPEKKLTTNYKRHINRRSGRL